jgi:hypothetical protein
MRRIVLRPVTEQLADGTWHAVYPELEASGDGDSEQAAREALFADHEFRQKTEPDYLERFLGMLNDPPESWYSDELTEEQYEDRMRRLMAGEDVEMPGSA